MLAEVWYANLLEDFKRMLSVSAPKSGKSFVKDLAATLRPVARLGRGDQITRRLRLLHRCGWHLLIWYSAFWKKVVAAGEWDSDRAPCCVMCRSHTGPLPGGHTLCECAPQGLPWRGIPAGATIAEQTGYPADL